FFVVEFLGKLEKFHCLSPWVSLFTITELGIPWGGSAMSHSVSAHVLFAGETWPNLGGAGAFPCILRCLERQRNSIVSNLLSSARDACRRWRERTARQKQAKVPRFRIREKKSRPDGRDLVPTGQLDQNVELISWLAR
ncbi:MAG TPA: hypothetical protein PLI43_14870, partial [Albidovulum sp.]|uniref:hypothetical protein n=1 Tax=Albidovulum sp. TaxID=1872424 RepID=UPI002BB8C4F1|nr:hypothetical protein [Albidovulum sp.]